MTEALASHKTLYALHQRSCLCLIWQLPDVGCICAGPLPQGIEALLLHSDFVEPPLVLISFTADCPKVGISVELAEDWHKKTSSSPDVMFQHLEASIKNLSADIRPSGEHSSTSSRTVFSTFLLEAHL